MNFLTNEYNTKYFNIIDNAKKEQRTKGQGVYYEDHHIMPKSMGGSNDSYNMILLTGEEHFKCHVLLPYFTENDDRDSMIYAWNWMSNQKSTPIDYEEYALLREAFAVLHSKRMKEYSHTQESKDKISAGQKGMMWHKKPDGTFTRCLKSKAGNDWVREAPKTPKPNSHSTKNYKTFKKPNGEFTSCDPEKADSSWKICNQITGWKRYVSPLGKYKRYKPGSEPIGWISWDLYKALS